MTRRELYEHYLATLQKTPGHTMVKHVDAGGKPCFRIRDSAVNPVANIPESVFREYIYNNIVHKINEREWQLKNA